MKGSPDLTECHLNFESHVKVGVRFILLGCDGAASGNHLRAGLWLVETCWIEEVRWKW